MGRPKLQNSCLDQLCETKRIVFINCPLASPSRSFLHGSIVLSLSLSLSPHGLTTADDDSVGEEEVRRGMRTSLPPIPSNSPSLTAFSVPATSSSSSRVHLRSVLFVVAYSSPTSSSSSSDRTPPYRLLSSPPSSQLLFARPLGQHCSSLE